MNAKHLTERILTEAAAKAWHDNWNDRAAVRRAANCPWPSKGEDGEGEPAKDAAARAIEPEPARSATAEDARIFDDALMRSVSIIHEGELA